jgi:UDP-N-acetylglucosamine 2-epimerase
MKIAIVLGTRPEIIKMASVMDEIEKRGHELLLIHTGQHYDKEMSENFFIDLKLPTPNYNIHVGSGSHGKQTGKMMEGIEEVLLDEKPDILLVQGDTNAVLAGALVASKLHIPVGHVEAGLRSFDETMPEEINRLAADICSKLYFVPTEESAVNLAMEGISRKRIFITGNTVVDACFRNLEISKNRDKSEYDEGLAELDIDNDKVYSLTASGEETIGFFADKIPYSIREKLTNCVNIINKEQNLANEITCDYYPINNTEYCVKFNMKENNVTMLSMDIYIGDKETAKRTSEYLLSDTAGAYSKIMEVINNGIKELK